MGLPARVWVGTAIGVALAFVANPGILDGGEKEPVKSVAEWEPAPATDVQMSPMSVAQLLGEFDKVAAAGKRLRSWEARCRITSQIHGDGQPGRAVPSAEAPDCVTTTHSMLLGSCGRQWFSERRSGDWQGEKVEYRNYCDGEHVQTVGPREKAMSIRTQDEYAVLTPESTHRPELPVGFPPFLETTREHWYLIPESLPDIRKVLVDPDARVLPWRTRVDGHTCYVVERTTLTESPIFRSSEELDVWEKQNPGRRAIRMVNPNAKPDDKRIDKETVRLALDPESGFMPTRWACKREFTFPGVDHFDLPSEEIVCTDFREFGAGGQIAGRFQYTRYSTDPPGNQKVMARQEVTLESFEVDREYPSDFFHVDPPKGYRILDLARGIVYSAGDSEEKIATLLTAVKAKKAFYEELKKNPAPALEGSLWLNTEPIRLEDARGRNIRLYFWSIGCGPCRYQLPHLQQEWAGRSQQSDNPAVFISIHQYVDGKELQELKDLLHKEHITFPVMVDSRAPDGKAWGKTSASYRVYSEPCEVSIDTKGHVVRHDDETRGLVQENDWWMRSLAENAKSKDD